METMVIAKPRAVYKARALSITSGGHAAADMAENSGESATAAAPVWSKNSKHLLAQTLLHRSCGQGAWLVLTGRCGCARWVQRLGAGLAAVAFIRKLARTGFLTIWVGSRAKVRY